MRSESESELQSQLHFITTFKIQTFCIESKITMPCR